MSPAAASTRINVPSRMSSDASRFVSKSSRHFLDLRWLSATGLRLARRAREAFCVCLGGRCQAYEQYLGRLDPLVHFLVDAVDLKVGVLDRGFQF